MRLIDAHCHLDEDYTPDPQPLLERAREAGVVHFVVNGLWRSPGNFGNARALADRFPGLVSPTVGVHPHDSAQATAEDYEAMERMAADPAVVGIGETGLDFHYNHSPPDVQRERFRWSIALAKKVGKPLVVHVREANAEAAQILKEEGAQEVGGQIHCFSGGVEDARAYLELGFHLSISGIVTFKSAENIREAVRYAPIDRLLVETDSPYLAPVPYRGKKNEPAWVVETAKKVAEVKGETLERVAEETTENACRLLRLSLS